MTVYNQELTYDLLIANIIQNLHDVTAAGDGNGLKSFALMVPYLVVLSSAILLISPFSLYFLIQTIFTQLLHKKGNYFT